MGRYTLLIALTVSILSWFATVYLLAYFFDRVGMPIALDTPTTILELNTEEHRFDEKVVNGRSTGTGDVCFVLALVFSRLVYKLLDSRRPISRREKRLLLYTSVGFTVWAFFGELLRTSVGLAPGSFMLWITGAEWMDTPLDPRVVTYMVRKLVHLAIGAAIFGLCVWDFARTLHPNDRPSTVGPDSHES